VEHFLITSIEYVKNQIAYERMEGKENGSPGKAGATSQPAKPSNPPSLRGQDSSSTTVSNGPNQKVVSNGSTQKRSGQRGVKGLQSHEETEGDKLPDIRLPMSPAEAPGGSEYVAPNGGVPSSHQGGLSEETALTSRSNEVPEVLLRAVDDMASTAPIKRRSEDPHVAFSLSTPAASDRSHRSVSNVEEDAATAGRSLDRRRKPKVDISDLTWADREKVLRLLFARINSAYQPSYFGAPPPPPPEQEESGRWTRGPTSVLGKPDMV
jgi:hypothetical protein